MLKYEVIDTVLDDCPICGKKHIINICKEDKTTIYKNQEVTYINIFYLCDNIPDNSEDGNRFYPGLLLGENIMRLKDNYRKINGLMLSDEIINLRRQLNLNQEEFSILLGYDNDRIKNIETKMAQSEEENNKLMYVKGNIHLIKNLLIKYNNDLAKISQILDNHLIDR